MLTTEKGTSYIDSLVGGLFYYYVLAPGNSDYQEDPRAASVFTWSRQCLWTEFLQTINAAGGKW